VTARTKLTLMIPAVAVASALTLAGAATIAQAPPVGRLAAIATAADGAGDGARPAPGGYPADPPIAAGEASDLAAAGAADPIRAASTHAPGAPGAPGAPDAAGTASTTGTAGQSHAPPGVADLPGVADPTPAAGAGPGASTRRPPPSPPARASGDASSAVRKRPPAPVDNLASRLRTVPAETRQLIIVHAAGSGTTHASVELFQRTSGRWWPASELIAARIGARGFNDNKMEGDLTTPTGMYSLGPTVYGVLADPGVKYSYHRLVEHDYWNGNSDSPQYNQFVHGSNPGGASEALWKITPQYHHFAVINYNTPAVPQRGSAIFLHVMVPGRATAGCVSLAEPDLVRVLRWLDPAASPRIVLAPDEALGRY